jgi:hypothetical protein
MDEQKKADRSGWWIALAGTTGAIAGTLITGTFNYLDHKSDIDAKMIELSIGILRAQPTPETTPLRDWAIDVIEKRADFSFNERQKVALRTKELPYTAGITSSANNAALAAQIGAAVAQSIKSQSP